MITKKQRIGTYLSLGIAVLLIVFFSVLLQWFLAYAEEPSEGVVGSEMPETSGIPSPTQIGVPEGLETIVYLGGNELPEGAVSSQYAIAVASEVAERVYGKPLLGKVFCMLLASSHSLADEFGVEGVFWCVTAEVDGGSISISVTSDTGVDFMGNLYQGEHEFGTWFDEWDESVADEERIMGITMIEEAEAERAMREIPAGESEYRHSVKRDLMLEQAQRWADLPHGARAVELVEACNLADGAQAVSGIAYLEGTVDDVEVYVVEVALDDGTYLFVNVAKSDIELIGYERSALSLPEFLYGPL